MAEQHVMLVEDELVLLMLMRDELEAAGYVVHEAANALAAFEAMQRQPQIGLVVTDVRMPGSGDGRALAHYIRTIKPNIPIIIASGTEVPPAELPSEGVHVMMKPVDMDAFVRMVQWLLPASKND
jgi:two-component system, response regulator PdtaR